MNTVSLLKIKGLNEGICRCGVRLKCCNETVFFIYRVCSGLSDHFEYIENESCDFYIS